jgi:hypothetical protein
MIMTEFIHRFIKEHNVKEFEKDVAAQKGITTTFALSYYDTYVLLAATQKNIKYLNEDIIKEIKLHKNKLYFIISYNKHSDVFELDKIIYDAPIGKCIRVITAIRRALVGQGIGTIIEDARKGKTQYTKVFLTKF